jgi:hypothetical protein
MKKFNFYGFITVYGILFLIILYKVLNVPVTTDEVPTVFFYSTFSFWDIMMFPDNWPNNHILNTMLAKCCIAMFGKEQWAIRLPNLLIFILFAIMVFRILKLVLKQNSWFFLPGALLFVNPYLLDFFGLCRGYGLSTTFVTVSIFLLLEGYQKQKNWMIWLSMFTSMLASYANFTVLVFWPSAVILVWFYFIIENKGRIKSLVKPTLIIFFISLAYLALIITPILKMQGTDQFKYWSSGGFYTDTIISLIREWRYNSKILSSIKSSLITGFIAIVFFLNIYFLIRHLKKENFSLRSFRDPIVISVLLLLLPVFINILQTIILKTPNLNGRTALFFYPLFSTFIIVAFSMLPKLNKQWINKFIAIAVGIIFILNLTHRISLKSVKEWEYDQNSIEVINYLKEKYKGAPISLKTNWILHSSFYFYYDSGKIPWLDLQPYDYNIDIITPSEYYYVFAEDYKLLEPRFEIIHKFSPDRWLLKQRR